MEIEVWGAMPPEDLDDLIRELTEEGHEVQRSDRRPLEERSLGFETPSVVLWLRDHVAVDVAVPLAGVAADWVRRRFKRRRGPVQVIYGPNDEILAEVPIDDRPNE